jgi:uncharacterized membrane protein
VRILRGLLTAGYPLLVYAGLELLEPRSLALGLAAAVALRGVSRWRQPRWQELRRLAPPALLLLAALLASALWNDPRGLFLAPVLANGALLLAFGRTLVGGGPTLVESLARLQVPDLPADEVRYCRGVTWLWCGFFAVNGSVALLLALGGDRETWALYNGVIAYALVGLLFAVEFTVRSWRFGRYGGTLVEPLFRRLFSRGPAA